MVSFEYDVYGLGTVNVVSLPSHPLPQKMLPYLSNVFFLPLPQELTVQCVLEAPFAQVFSDSECSTAFSLRKGLRYTPAVPCSSLDAPACVCVDPQTPEPPC